MLCHLQINALLLPLMSPFVADIDLSLELLGLEG